MFILVVTLSFSFCSEKRKAEAVSLVTEQDSLVTYKPKPKRIDPDSIIIEKALVFEKYTMEDVYPYKDTTRVFQWDKIRKSLALIDSIQQEQNSWGILQNYRNKNGEAVLVRNYKRNAYKRIADSLGVERYQSVPLFLPTDSLVAECYGRDGSLVKFLGNVSDTSRFLKVETVHSKGEWLVPKKYVKLIGDTILFKKVVFVDVTNQNIATLEKDQGKWLVKSMNPATTGVHRPPHAQETPTGLFVVQEKKSKMFFVVDGTTDIAGFAPHASRFTNGAYVHGVPVNLPRTEPIEYSRTLGTTPRSHMCVRNASSHAKFVYDWASVNKSLVFVID